MQETEAVLNARREMEICNACRYCEGFCAVFPAVELRREFTAGDLSYLANLCHGCRGCYYACQYAPPHEWGITPREVNGKPALEFRAAKATAVIQPGGSIEGCVLLFIGDRWALMAGMDQLFAISF